jgi:hypothetical protein
LINVSLSMNEVRIAAAVGVERYIRPIEQGQNNRYGAQNDWTNDINSCIAELAVAKATNQYWHAAPAQYEGSDRSQTRSKITNDVGVAMEVRTSRTGKLIVRSGDKDDRFYIFVTWPKWTKDGCSVSILGGLRAKDAKRDEFIETFGKSGRPPCYAVPADRLIPTDQLFGLQ